MPKQIFSLKDPIKNKEKISHLQLKSLRARLLKKVPLPKVTLEGPKKVQPGDKIVFKVKGFPLPIIDLYEGRITKKKTLLKRVPVIVSFKGAEAPITTVATYSPKTRLLKTIIPEDAVKGKLSIYFPVRESFGKAGLLKKADPNNKILKKEIGKWQFENLKCEKSKDNKEDRSPYDERAPIERHSYLEVITEIIWPYWRFCSLGICRLGCPHNAIRFDSRGRCYVDPARCRGQSYYRERPYDREEDVECWLCFRASDSTVSTRCPYRKIRKVVHIGERCCANCPLPARSTGRDLMELCPYGAISVSGSRFVVDKALCRGCMICYDGITCFFNRERDPMERDIRMVAHIGPTDF